MRVAIELSSVEWKCTTWWRMTVTYYLKLWV